MTGYGNRDVQKQQLLMKQQHLAVTQQDKGTRVNEILAEQQRMIYAPQQREKTNQGVRSPFLNK